VMSLGRAFLQAGAPGVVGSLWPLRDDDAAALFDGFYQRLAAGVPVGEALSGAGRALVSQGAPAAAWAGLVVLGDAQRTLAVPQREPAALALAVAVLAALLAALALSLALWRWRQARG